MNRTIIVYGLFSGFIITGLTFTTMPLWKEGILNFETGELIGYASMVVSLSLVFFGIRSYRDNYATGVISFGKGIRIGLLIAILASLVYVIGWEIYYQSTGNEFMSQYSSYYISKLEAEGASAEELGSRKTEMENIREMYKNPFLRFGITLSEILPVGIFIAFVSAAILKRSM
ncbi:MAG: DUF4199 domain-containing protein [Flammeovirgaceae bacterium]|nr:DUF4199 domain-containing protein [Flammeovirgaceae bacterium]